VDDDAAVRRAFRRLLEASGFGVATFASGEEFLQQVGVSELPACLVLDIHLGGMTGFEVHAALGRARIHVPVVFITAHDDAANAARFRESTAVACLLKPVDESTLIDAVRHAIGLSAPA
jgi:FixJ family two-component response regulator